MRPGRGAPEFHGTFDFERMVGFASMTPDGRRFVCNATHVNPHDCLVGWLGSAPAEGNGRPPLPSREDNACANLLESSGGYVTHFR
jgi:hypothetical protein